MEKVNEVKERFAEIYDEEKEVFDEFIEKLSNEDESGKASFLMSYSNEQFDAMILANLVAHSEGFYCCANKCLDGYIVYYTNSKENYELYKCIGSMDSTDFAHLAEMYNSKVEEAEA